MDTKEQIKIMQHFVDGGEVEYYDRLDSRWLPVREPLWNWYGSTYRVKPKPLECWANMYELGPCGCHASKQAAVDNASGGALRVAVHMREVTD